MLIKSRKNRTFSAQLDDYAFDILHVSFENAQHYLPVSHTRLTPEK